MRFIIFKPEPVFICDRQYFFVFFRQLYRLQLFLISRQLFFLWHCVKR